MHIEKRGNVEYLIGAPDACDGCDAVNEGGACCHHLNGEHLSVAWPSSDGACEILSRWPIVAESAAFARGVLDGLRRVESMLASLEGRGLDDGRKLELLRECISAEIADVSKAIQEHRAVETIESIHERFAAKSTRGAS